MARVGLQHLAKAFCLAWSSAGSKLSWAFCEGLVLVVVMPWQGVTQLPGECVKGQAKPKKDSLLWLLALGRGRDLAAKS
jgi:hypothetical protein